MKTLQNLLKGNGAFSAGSGALLLVGSPWLDSAFGLETWLLAATGIVLVAYGAQIAQLSRPDRAVAGGKFATAMDLGWVFGGAVILIGFPTALTTAGRVALLLATIAVAGFAAGQFRALRRLSA